MHPIVLKNRVDITGPNFWGLKGKLTFFPTLVSGWRWNINPAYPIIEPSIVANKQRRLRLSYYGKKLEIYEHLGVLRWFGLCNLFIESSPWFPYYGRSIEIWQAIKPFCEENTSKEIKWYTIEKPVRWEYPELRGGQKAFTEIQPNTEQALEMKITGSY